MAIAKMRQIDSVGRRKFLTRKHQLRSISTIVRPGEKDSPMSNTRGIQSPWVGCKSLDSSVFAVGRAEGAV